MSAQPTQYYLDKMRSRTVKKALYKEIHSSNKRLSFAASSSYQPQSLAEYLLLNPDPYARTDSLRVTAADVRAEAEELAGTHVSAAGAAAGCLGGSSRFDTSTSASSAGQERRRTIMEESDIQSIRRMIVDEPRAEILGAHSPSPPASPLRSGNPDSSAHRFPDRGATDERLPGSLLSFSAADTASSRRLLLLSDRQLMRAHLSQRERPLPEALSHKLCQTVQFKPSSAIYTNVFGYRIPVRMTAKRAALATPAGVELHPARFAERHAEGGELKGAVLLRMKKLASYRPDNAASGADRLDFLDYKLPAIVADALDREQAARYIGGSPRAVPVAPAGIHERGPRATPASDPAAYADVEAIRNDASNAIVAENLVNASKYDPRHIARVVSAVAEKSKICDLSAYDNASLISRVLQSPERVLQMIYGINPENHTLSEDCGCTCHSMSDAQIRLIEAKRCPLCLHVYKRPQPLDSRRALADAANLLGSREARAKSLYNIDFDSLGGNGAEASRVPADISDSSSCNEDDERLKLEEDYLSLRGARRIVRKQMRIVPPKDRLLLAATQQAFFSTKLWTERLLSDISPGMSADEITQLIHNHRYDAFGGKIGQATMSASQAGISGPLSAASLASSKRKASYTQAHPRPLEHQASGSSLNRSVLITELPHKDLVPVSTLKAGISESGRRSRACQQILRATSQEPTHFAVTQEMRKKRPVDIQLKNIAYAKRRLHELDHARATVDAATQFIKYLDVEELDECVTSSQTPKFLLPSVSCRLSSSELDHFKRSVDSLGTPALTSSLREHESLGGHGGYSSTDAGENHEESVSLSGGKVACKNHEPKNQLTAIETLNAMLLSGDFGNDVTKESPRKNSSEATTHPIPGSEYVSALKGVSSASAQDTPDASFEKNVPTLALSRQLKNVIGSSHSDLPILKAHEVRRAIDRAKSKLENFVAKTELVDAAPAKRKVVSSFSLHSRTDQTSRAIDYDIQRAMAVGKTLTTNNIEERGSAMAARQV